MPKYIPSKWLKRNFNTRRYDPNPRRLLRERARRITRLSIHPLNTQPIAYPLIRINPIQQPTFQLQFDILQPQTHQPVQVIQPQPQPIQVIHQPVQVIQQQPTLPDYHRPTVEFADKIDTLIKKLNSATETYNIDADYVIDLLRQISHLCPFYYFVIPSDIINKVRNEHMQYADLVEDVCIESFRNCRTWYPTKREEYYALNRTIRDIREMLKDVLNKDYEEMYAEEKDFLGVNNYSNFYAMKNDIEEVIRSIDFGIINQEEREFNFVILTDWIQNSKLLRGRLFRLLSICLAIASKSAGQIESARERLFEILREHNESSEETYLSEEISSIHNNEPSFVEDDRNVLSLLDLEANSEELKEFDELLEKQHHKKF